MKDIGIMDFQQLPDWLRNILPGVDFLAGYLSYSENRASIWVVDREKSKPRELIFNIENQSLISRFELLNEIQLKRIKTMVIGSYLVKVGYSLEEGTDILFDKYEIFDISGQRKIAETGQPHFTDCKMDVSSMVEDAVRAAAFPEYFSGLPLAEKVNYWVANLYRLRRHTAEAGGHEDDIFSSDLISDMKRYDPNIESLLPGIMEGLSIMENSQEDLMTEFTRRTGIEKTK